MSDVPLYRGALSTAQDVVSIRLRTQVTADALGLSVLARTRAAAAVSEVTHAAQGSGQLLTVTFSVAGTPAGSVLRLSFSAANGELTGLLTAGEEPVRTVERLVDSLTVNETSIVMDLLLPSPATEAVRASIRSRLAAEPTLDPVAALQRQNEELTTALLAVREREAGLARLNSELAETNRGVVALYAELEERAEQVRNAQRDVFEELGRALRPPPPVLPRCELAVRYQPAQANSPTGGDLYDWQILPDGSLYIGLVDAVGHGVTSTRDALEVTHAVRTLVLEGHPLDEVLGRADTLLRRPTASVMATAQVALLDPHSGRLSVAGAGHPPVLLLTGKATRFLDTDGRPLGYPDAGSDGAQETRLSAGDIVLLYTDGVVEQDRDIGHGMQVLAEACSSCDSAGSLEEFLDAVLALVAGPEGWRDDTVLMALRWTDPA